MFQWKYVLFATLFGMITLFSIPIYFESPEEVQKLQFHTFMTQYKKSYKIDSTEYHKRFLNFKLSLATISELNLERKNNDSALYGITQFADLSREEFENQYLLKDLRRFNKAHYKDNNSDNHYHHHHHHKRSFAKREVSDLPDYVNWKDKGVVSAVKDQQLCGACWAFSTVETIESMNAIKNGVLEDLSVQEVIDCAGNGNMGCNGGDICSLLAWMVTYNIKLEKTSSYPLVLQTQACKLKKTTTEGVSLASNYTCNNFINKEQKILTKLAAHGPVSVAVNALPWQFYLGGVLESKCDNSIYSLNHAVQIVGYDKSATVPHYIVRNSWGVWWGLRGYIKLAIGKNTCGLATEVASLDVQ